MRDQFSIEYLEPACLLGGWQQKCWGWTRCIFRSDTCLVFELRTKSGWQCSRHYHESRSNRFVIQSGLVGVTIEAGTKPGRYLLHPGDAVDVHPPYYHRFESFEPSSLLEIYYSRDGQPISESDIVRDESNLGGRMPNF